MFTREESIDIRGEPQAIFDLFHDYRRRLEWDPGFKQARILGDAACAGRGVKTRCVAHNRVGGLAMETVYVTFNRPRVAAAVMTRGPIVFQSFAASLRQESVRPGVTRVRYRYSLVSRPRWLRWLIEPIARAIFSRDTRSRLAALKRAIELA
jgi:hypothetical protein